MAKASFGSTLETTPHFILRSYQADWLLLTIMVSKSSMADHSTGSVEFRLIELWALTFGKSELKFSMLPDGHSTTWFNSTKTIKLSVGCTSHGSTITNGSSTSIIPPACQANHVQDQDGWFPTRTRVKPLTTFPLDLKSVHSLTLMSWRKASVKETRSPSIGFTLTRENVLTDLK